MGLIFLAGLSAAKAQYPDKPVKIVVPVAAGGGVDVMARLLALKLTERLNQQFVVENRPGAAGVIGSKAVIASPADGTTLLYTPSSLSLSVVVNKTPPYDLAKDFTPIINVAISPYALVVNPSVPAKDLKEFVAYAKANPGKVQFGHPGHGTYAHMTQLSLQDMIGTTFNLIPYRGGPQMTSDMLGGQIDAVIDLLGSYLPLIRDGKLRALAVIGNSRVPQLPDVPLLKEVGLNFTAEPWYGLQGPKGIPREIVDQVNAAATEILNDSAVKEKLAAAGITPRTGTPEDFEQVVKKEIEKWRPIVVKYDIKYD
jgi:tripartite-type tricarboxylate transporter receptor subunit TctC